ncbi:unnamed protein product [Aphanomyces euteiches]
MVRISALIALAATASAVLKHKTIHEILLDGPTVESVVQLQPTNGLKTKSLTTTILPTTLPDVNVTTAATTTSPNLFMNDLAQKYKALVVSVEHRFYGQSQPRPDLTVESMKYLTSDQALQDLAKFPNNFAGSVASSAPVWAKTNFVEYSEKVAYGLKFFGGDEWLNNVGQAMKDFHALMVSTKQEDADLFKKLFNPCAPIKNDLDRAVLEVDITMASNRSRSTTLANKTLSPLEKLASFNQKFSWDSRQCTGVDYDTEWISGINSTALDTENIDRQWFFQTCNELGYGQTTTGSNSIFGRAYGITDTEKRIANTLKFYGGLKVDVANVVWPGGTIDPWSALGFTNTTKPVNPHSDVVYIEGTAHCADMYSRAKNRAPAWALDRIEANVDSFLRGKC